MSFSKSVSGQGRALREAAAAWPEEVKKQDEGYHASPGVIEGHAAQVKAAHGALDVLGEVYPDRQINVNVSGHAGDDGGGSISVSYNFPKDATS